MRELLSKARYTRYILPVYVYRHFCTFCARIYKPYVQPLYTIQVVCTAHPYILPIQNKLVMQCFSAVGMYVQAVRHRHMYIRATYVRHNRAMCAIGQLSVRGAGSGLEVKVTGRFRDGSIVCAAQVADCADRSIVPNIPYG